jgi:hypothetical protein
MPAFLTSRVRRHGNLIKPDALPVATFVADVAGEIARQLESERSFLAPPNKGAQNWADRAANL